MNFDQACGHILEICADGRCSTNGAREVQALLMQFNGRNVVHSEVTQPQDGSQPDWTAAEDDGLLVRFRTRSFDRHAWLRPSIRPGSRIEEPPGRRFQQRTGSARVGDEQLHGKSTFRTAVTNDRR